MDDVTVDEVSVEDDTDVDDEDEDGSEDESELLPLFDVTLLNVSLYTDDLVLLDDADLWNFDDTELESAFLLISICPDLVDNPTELSSSVASGVTLS